MSEASHRDEKAPIHALAQLPAVSSQSIAEIALRCIVTSINLLLLGITAIPRLSKKLRVRVDFPEYRSLFGIPQEAFEKTVGESREILNTLLKDSEVSWWDVYCSSDIGMERLELAEEMRLRGCDTVLDVGCGRGYFSIAAARFCKTTVGLDLMNGLGRHSWWKNFRASMDELDISDKVLGAKADAMLLPFRASSFTAAVAVHSIRNFQKQSIIEAAIREMKCAVVKGGRVIVAESLPVANNRAQEAHLQLFRCMAKYTQGELYYFEGNELLEIFERTGFKDIETKTLECGLSATPPLFSIEPYLQSIKTEGGRKSALEEYEKAISMIREHGEMSPPTLLVQATK